MKTIFPKWINKAVPVVALSAGLIPLLIASGLYLYGSDKNLSVGYKPVQPIAFSHELHAGEMGMDCRYCHVNVERSPHATVPPAQICMNCHKNVKTTSPKLALLREVAGVDNNGQKVAAAERGEKFGKPIPWVRIHNIPDYAYFDHSIHINANVGCKSCHGRIDQMPVVKQVKPLTMGWCLDCHDNPYEHIRPPEVKPTDMKWPASAADKSRQEEYANKLREVNQLHKAKEFAKLKERKDLQGIKNFNPPRECSACHR